MHEYNDWPSYESHKVVRAKEIIGIDSDDAEEPMLFVDPGDKWQEMFFPTEPAMAKRAKVGDYAVIYADGYKSVSPAEAFRGGYTKLRT